jgi:hypothetical protein
MRIIPSIILALISSCNLFCQEGIFYYTKDSLKIFRKIEEERDKDSSTFLENVYGYTKKGGELYLMDEKVNDVDINSLILIENKGILAVMGIDVSFIKDKNHVFYGGSKIEAANSQTFEVLFYDYAKDDRYVYMGDEIIKDADPMTFTCLSMEFTKDESNFYSYGNKLLGDEAIYVGRLFKYCGNISFYIQYTVGGNEVYYRGRKLNCDLNSFQDLQDGYAKDKLYSYYEGERIIGADPITFTRTINSEEEEKLYKLLKLDIVYLDSPFAKDKNHYYYFGKTIK